MGRNTPDATPDRDAPEQRDEDSGAAARGAPRAVEEVLARDAERDARCEYRRRETQRLAAQHLDRADDVPGRRADRTGDAGLRSEISPESTTHSAGGADSANSLASRGHRHCGATVGDRCHLLDRRARTSARAAAPGPSRPRSARSARAPAELRAGGRRLNRPRLPALRSTSVANSPLTRSVLSASSVRNSSTCSASVTADLSVRSSPPGSPGAPREAERRRRRRYCGVPPCGCRRPHGRRAGCGWSSGRCLPLAGRCPARAGPGGRRRRCGTARRR